MEGELNLVAGRRVFFTVPGLPIGKKAPHSRVVTPKGKKPFANLYLPPDVRKYEATVKKEAQIAFKEQVGGEPFQGQVKVTIFMFLPWAQSTTKKTLARIEDGLLAPTKKPDCSNVAKSVEDAMNKIVFKDDAHVVDLNVRKRYSDKPRVSVLVTEFVDPEPELLADLPKPKPKAEPVVEEVAERSGPTACGAKSPAECTNHDKKGAPWCVDCLPPGLQKKKNRPKGMIVLGEDQ